jgi:alpha-beta hydrolase superfamily lysophospholipase
MRLVFKLVVAALAVLGLVAGGLVALLGVPPRQLPPLASISRTAGAVDRSDMPALQAFTARDGTSLAFRHYAPQGAGAVPVAVVVHGSSGSAASVHALSRALASSGMEVYAPDIRGHGASGTRGDIAYQGQLDDDLVDLVARIRRDRPDAPLTLIGHSSGGGFALRVAGSANQDLFARTVLLAPYLGYDSPTSRPDSGGWASASVPRFVALAVLQRLGLPYAESLPTLSLAVAPGSGDRQTATYSYRLMRNFAVADRKADFAAARHPVLLIAGSADELMLPERYRDVAGPKVDVRLLEGVDHMDVVRRADAVAAIAAAVAQSAARS